jgi:ParB family chromosome partitioning protein
MSLGKGLESLIPPRSSGDTPGQQPSLSAEEPTARKGEHVFYIETDRIKPNPHQPRRDFNESELQSLADSIRLYGILQPLVVTKREIEMPYGSKVEYEILAGERRLRAAKLAGFSQVPVVIREATEKEKLELAVVENVQRADLNPIEEARAYKKMADEHNLTQEQVAERVAKSREAVANKLRLLNLPHDVQQYVSDGRLTEGHAKVLLQLKNPERARLLADEAIKQGWSVRALEERVKKEFAPMGTQSVSTPASDPELEEYKKKVEETLGAPVSIQGSRQHGRLAISFSSPEELRRIIEKLAGGEEDQKQGEPPLLYE